MKSKAPLVHTFAVITAAATFVLLLVGGLVNPTGSSLACPDWPLCHGQVFPRMQGGVLFEHSHRLVAGAVAVATAVLAFLLVVREKRARLGLAAIGLVALQAALGGATVLLKLPPEISIAHLALSQAFFATILYIAVRTAPGGGAPALLPRGARAWVIGAAAAVYAQILLGAVVRHLHAAYACLDQVPLCYGQAWPDNFYARVHMVHRFGAVVTTLVVLVAALRAARALPRRAPSRMLALAAPSLVLLQVLLGVWTVWTMKGLVPVEAHLGVGAALWATMWLLAITTRRREATAAVPAASESAPAPAAAVQT